MAGLFLLVVLFGIRQTKRAPRALVVPLPEVSPALVTQLAETRAETAIAKIEQGRPDQALALLVTALMADPTAADALALVAKILSETTWHLPVLVLEHPLPIERIECASSSSLWVGLAGESNTLVRWNLEKLRLESVFFPLPGEEIRSLVMDPSHRRMVVERAGILLLCDAQSLKPIKDLGHLPDFVTPSSVIVFSEDGLLMAHPVSGSGERNLPTWHLRDATTGEILRTYEPDADATEPPLAAFLDRRALRVLLADGSLLDIPVSPVDLLVTMPAVDQIALRYGQFSKDGKSALVLIDHGPHRATELKVMPAHGNDHSLEPALLLERFSWCRHPGIWSGLLRDSQSAPLSVDGDRLLFTHSPHAPIHTSSPITAVAASGSLRMVGERDGTLTIHQLLPQSVLLDNGETSSASAGADAIAAFENLTAALAGLRHDKAKRSFTQVPAEERQKCFDACDFGALGGLFPGLDFSPMMDARAAISYRKPGTGATQPLLERLVRASREHPQASNAQASKLAMALEGDSAEAIEQILAAAVEMPPLLRKLSLSRIAWIQGRKADALAGWSEEFPDLAQVRLREDWDGWEQADFGPALEKFRLNLFEVLAMLEVPEDPSKEQIEAVVERLTDPDTLRSVGKARLAEAMLHASRILASIPGEAEKALKFALLASNLGAPEEPRLRAEALALGALGEYPKARDRWVLLLTEHPVDTHQPSDYTEAAYTAFESADPGQALEILTTGMHRFAADVDFALRAGWIALLTGNAERAYRFLLTGREIGYPPAKLEYATVLLTIAAAQAGASDDAVLFHEQLIEMNPTWQDPAFIESLEWPEEMKSTLRQLTW